MQPIDIVEWLRQNPEFFEEFADELAEIYVPHSHRGQAVSLAERQLLTLRDKNRALELRLSELLQFGEENDITSDKLHRLTVDLMRATDMPGIIGTLEYHLRERFGVPHVALRLWLPGMEGSLREFEPVGEDVTRLAQNLVSPYCGPYVTDEVLGWFGEAGPGLKSFAQFALRAGEEPFGILAMASEDSDRFYPDMGTLYLQRLSDLVSAALLRIVRDEPANVSED
ncbi:hypothetical protein SAMN05660284_00376 [Formivibrio citricus]|uniref:DUF484 family protein n=1 Tax=Formivibrio citricus TaxID=83765 RepID=A0A1I4VTB1_9NEIS|nr:DUF484 family protein [Formivibrio citricus]SFN04504.1 hypothetical protein SAMN05660284_00376 [Formivibrio citricus]